MTMEQSGYVTEIANGIIKIRVDRQSACGGHCASCKGCPQTAVLLEYPDDPENPFFVGEKVQIVMPARAFFGGMLQSYGVLIVGLFGGAILGYFLTEKETASILGGFLGLALGGILVWLLGKHSKTDFTLLRNSTQKK